jgi:hypothetical protein
VEQVADIDDEVMEKFLEGGATGVEVVSAQLLLHAIRRYAYACATHAIHTPRMQGWRSSVPNSCSMPYAGTHTHVLRIRSACATLKEDSREVAHAERILSACVAHAEGMRSV